MAIVKFNITPPAVIRVQGKTVKHLHISGAVQGIPGPQGPAGEKGDKGDKGDPGDSGSIDPNAPVDYIIRRSIPGGILYKEYLNDDGSPQIELYEP
jgi:hypothetical protein